MSRIAAVAADILEIAVNFSRTSWATRAYLLHNPRDGRLLLVDTGSAGSQGVILRAIDSLGCQPADLEAIIVTHWHEDHTGGLGAMMDAAGDAVRVLVPAAEIDILQTQAPRPVPFWGWLKKLGDTPMPPGKLRPGQAARLEPLSAGDPLLRAWDLQLLNTPGHSVGHISLLSPGRRALFAGDALLCYGRTVFTFPHNNVAQTEASARQLLALDFDHLLP
ncbi:MAG: MBL fold metallo-hydrolase, partial [Anaerolineae bacterium]